MTIVKALAPAKLNLGLEVIRRREDGFHEIATIFQTVGLSDSITVRESSSLILHVSDESLQGESNLAFKAALALKTRYSVVGGAKISLEKRIPSSAGLGGASSNAAATMLALSELWGLSIASEELQSIASELGSDVPFLFTGGTALGLGRGELIRPLRQQLDAWAVIATPKIDTPNKTATMFRRLMESDFSPGAEIAHIADQIERGEPLSPESFPNPFRRHAFELWPQLIEITERFRDAGAPGVALSGAGPSLYTLLSSEEVATRIQDDLKAKLKPDVSIVACKTISHVPPLVRDNR